MEPELIGRYEVIREIARGGMAVVYLAKDTYMDRQVAVKVLPRHFLHDPNFSARFTREARIVAALEHPAIVPIYDFGYHEDQPFMVSRYMSGGSLLARIRKNGEKPTHEVLSMLKRLAPALDMAHERGIVHRDLKPSNILFDQNDEPYVADFGIAKLAQASSALTGTALIGTPAYMSPEQFSGETELDGRSDIYSLGIIVFEMLSGELPYQAESTPRMMKKHLMDPIPSVLERRTDLPRGLDEFFHKVMAKEPGDRFQTMTELANAFEAALERMKNEVEESLEDLEIRNDLGVVDPPEDFHTMQAPIISTEQGIKDVEPLADMEPFDPSAPEGSEKGEEQEASIGANQKDDIYSTQHAPVEIASVDVKPEAAQDSEVVEENLKSPDKGKRWRIPIWGWLSGGIIGIALAVIFLLPLIGIDVTGLIAGVGFSSGGKLPPYVTGLLKDARVIAYTDFDDSLSENWVATDSNVSGGRLGIDGTASREWESGATYVGRQLSTGDAVFVRFRFSSASDFVLSLDRGSWQTSIYRQWGINELSQTETVRGNIWLGDTYLTGNLKMMSDHWYELLMAVGTNHELFMYLWDAENPEITAEQWWIFDPSRDGWAFDDWIFNMSLGYGKLDIDYFTLLSYVIMPELSEAEYAYWDGQQSLVIKEAYDDAFDAFSLALNKDPSCAACYRRRGIIQFFVYEDREAGLADFNAAINLEPDNWMGYRLLYYGYQYEDYELAKKYANKVIELAPDLANGYGYLGQTYLDEENFDSAAKVYKTASDLEPGVDEYLWKLCIAYNGQGNHGAAYEACSKCIEINPWHNTCHFDRALASDGLGDISAAKADFQAYLDLTDPDNCPECQQGAQDYIDQH